MSAELKFFFGNTPVRAMMIDDELWWVASDISHTLGYSMASAMLRSLDRDEKGVRTLHTLGGPQKVGFINESGLYSAALRSTHPDAKKFKRWVTHEILPTIRKTGEYSVHSKPAMDYTLPEVWELMSKSSAKAAEVIRLKDQQIEHLSSEVRIYDEQAEAEGVSDVGRVAKELEYSGLFLGGRNLFFKYLEEQKWVFRRHDPGIRWEAFQDKINAGYLQMKPVSYRRPDESIHSYSKVVFTPKGKIKIRKILDSSIPETLTLKELNQ